MKQQSIAARLESVVNSEENLDYVFLEQIYINAGGKLHNSKRISSIIKCSANHFFVKSVF